MTNVREECSFILKSLLSLIVTIFMLHGTALLADQTKLSRKDVIIDFKEEGFFKTIPFIALAGDMFFISDNDGHRILEYRLQGNKLDFLKPIGRPGQGPGDLMRPTEIGVSDGRLAVYDELGFSFFGLDGEYMNKFPLRSKSKAFLFIEHKIYMATYDSTKPDLIQVYRENGDPAASFQEKRKFFPIRYDIHKGFTPDSVEHTLFDGILRTDGRHIFWLSQRFGHVVKYDFSGKTIEERDLVPLLGENEKAKAKENRKNFIDQGYDLDKNKRRIPNNYLFDDARISDGRLYLLLESFDFLAKKKKDTFEIIVIDLSSWAVEKSYAADLTPNESSKLFLVIGDQKEPVFLMPLRDFKEGEKICLFK